MERYWDGLTATIFTDLPDDILEYICKMAEEMYLAEKRKACHKKILEGIPPSPFGSGICEIVDCKSGIGVDYIEIFFSSNTNTFSESRKLLNYEEAGAVYKFMDNMLQQMFPGHITHPGVNGHCIQYGDTYYGLLVVKFGEKSPPYMQLYRLDQGDSIMEYGYEFIRCFSCMVEADLVLSCAIHPRKVMPGWCIKFVQEFAEGKEDTSK